MRSSGWVCEVVVRWSSVAIPTGRSSGATPRQGPPSPGPSVAPRIIRGATEGRSHPHDHGVGATTAGYGRERAEPTIMRPRQSDDHRFGALTAVSGRCRTELT